jgi:hypothetical protein
VYTGNRTVSITAVAMLGSLWAMAAGDVHEDGTEAMYFEPEIGARAGVGSQCGTDLHVEHIQYTAGGPRVDFEWNAESGELSFRMRTAIAAVTLPEYLLTAASAVPAASCESR